MGGVSGATECVEATTCPSGTSQLCTNSNQCPTGERCVGLGGGGGGGGGGGTEICRAIPDGGGFPHPDGGNFPPPKDGGAD
jgi:hypothetical protein